MKKPVKKNTSIEVVSDSKSSDILLEDDINNSITEDDILLESEFLNKVKSKLNIGNKSNESENLQSEKIKDTSKNTQDFNIESINTRKLPIYDKYAYLLVNGDDEGIFVPLNQNLTFKENDRLMGDLEINAKNSNNLLNKKVIMDSNGYYRSYKEIFTKFMIERDVKIKVADDYIEFKDLVKLAYNWLRIFNELVYDYYNEMIIKNCNDAKRVIAYRLKEFGANQAQNYISNVWLAKPFEIKTEFGTFYTYEIEHPRSKETLIKIYENLSNKHDLNLTREDALKTYYAGLELQKLRNDFLKHENINPALESVYADFNDALENILTTSDLFEIKSIKKVKLKNTVNAYVKYRFYEEYIV